ncbi:MAG: hypothetical protein AAFZ18_22535 [Myxococcota bacterium]
MGLSDATVTEDAGRPPGDSGEIPQDDWEETTSLKEDDNDQNFLFGHAVDIDGDRMLVGSIGHDEDGEFAGAAYVYLREGTQWTLEARLMPSDGEALKHFGVSVSLDGSYALVGAEWDDEEGFEAGAAYIFERVGSTWVERSKLVAETAGRQFYFGASVSLHGRFAAIGMPKEPSAGARGEVLLFEQRGEAWVEMAQLRAPVEGGSFGWRVSLQGNDLLVTSAVEDTEKGRAAGAVYYYSFDGTEWVLQQKLTASDGFAYANFGSAVSMDGPVAVVGNSMSEGGGWAYIFTFQSDTWVEAARLTPFDGSPGSPVGAGFGVDVAVSGDRVAVGSDCLAICPGAVYLFHRQDGSWREGGKVMASDGTSSDHFGLAVDIDGETIGVGAPSAGEVDRDRGVARGAVYTFELQSNP